MSEHMTEVDAALVALHRLARDLLAKAKGVAPPETFAALSFSVGYALGSLSKDLAIADGYIVEVKDGQGKA